MSFTSFVQAIFGNKSSRDMKMIQPLVETVKAQEAAVRELTNDGLREKTKELRDHVQSVVTAEKEEIARLKATIDDTPLDERESIFNQIDKLENIVLDKYEEVLNEIMPIAYSIIKETARRFAENEVTVVTATDFDRQLAANPANDFITIEGDKALYHNEWTAGGNKIKWDMVHYDVQIF